MKDNARQAANPEWKQLLRLGEQLVNQPTPTAQCELIIKAVGEILSAQVQVWLASPIYPLPGMPAMETLPDAQATPLAHQALAEQQMQCTPPLPENRIIQEGSAPFAVAVPMTANGAPSGVVQVERPDGPPFSEHDLSLLEGLVTHAAIAMDLTRQETLKEWRFEQLNLVRSVSGQIARLTNLDQLYQRVTQLIQETFHNYYVAIFTFDEPTGRLRFRASAGKAPSAPLEPGFEVAIQEGIIGTVGQSGVEIIAPDVQQETRYRFIDTLPETRSEATLPLKVEDRILGVLDFQSDKVHAFHPADVLVLQALADNIALAIESTRLYNNLERRAEQIQSVFEVSHALASILDLDQLLEEVVRLIQNRFGYPFVHVYTVHMGRRMVFYQAGTGERSEAMKQQGRHYALDDPLGLIPWVARNGKPFLSNDVLEEPLYRPAEVPPYDTRAELTVPLMAGDEVMGVLDIQSRESNAFDANDQSLFEALAAPIAAAMRNANLYRSEQWRRRVAESFRDVAHLISTNRPINELLSLILEKLEEILPCDASAIWLMQEDRALGARASAVQENGHRLRLAATRNIEVDDIFESLQEPSVQRMLERTLKSDDTLIRRPDDPLGPLGAALHFEQNYSSIAAPMRTDKGSLGVLTLAHHQEGRYGSEAQAITQTFASYAAVAIQNARLFSESQEQALISTMLLQVAEASQTVMTSGDLLATMIRLTRLLMGVRKCAFLLWEEGLQSFELKAWYGFEPAGQAPWLFSPRMPALARLSEERSTIYLDDPAIELDLPELSLAPEPGTIVMLPLVARGEVIGAFLVGLQTDSMPGVQSGFDPKALSILQGIAHQTALTVDNLSLLEARQEEAYVTAALLQVAQAVVSSNDLNDTLDTIVNLLPILVGIDTCIIYLWDAASSLYRPTQVYADSRREEEYILAHTFAPGQHNLLDSVRETGDMHLCQIYERGMQAEDWARLDCMTYAKLIEQTTPPRGDWLLGYPLSLQGQVFGAMVVRESNASPAFWERRLEIIQGIAQQASLAIQNDLFKQEMVETERMEREMQLARQIQETFLPDSMPQIPRWELDLRWETAREVGGDFYDIFRLSDNRLALVIADVSDKGLPAALYMTVARTLIRASAADNQSPAGVLGEVNRLLVSDSVEAMFITAVYAILSLDTGEMVFANAGHNRPLLFHHKTGQVEQLAKGGTSLGILDDLTLENHTLRIIPGDVLVLFTDGVTDIQSPDGDFFGEQRLEDLVHAYGREDVQNMLEHLDDALIDFRRGTPPTDDVTLVAVRREPPRRRASKTKR